jgi:tRNA U34 2-thiouridine synthase MnmA/TrmU
VDALRLQRCTWHLGALPQAGLECLVRARYRAAPAPATITAGEDGEGATVRFHSPHERPSRGQACVAYDLRDELCLGGGWIS